MPSEIASALAQTIMNGLRRKSIVSCSRWAEKFRILGKPFPGPLNFRYFPWARAMHDCDAQKWVGLKSAQVGFTEVALDRVFYTIDIKRQDCLYLLPSLTDASQFSASRFDPALELSPYLSELFSEVKNVGHKRAGSTNLYVRGTRSRSQLKSIPAALIVFDEVDEMTQKNLSLAEQRQAGQTDPQQIWISTPTTAGHGIDLEFRDSTKQHFHFECPSCSRWTELLYPDCLVITAEDLEDPNIVNTYIQCKECKAKLPHETKPEWLETGQWIEHNPVGVYPGWHINGLYSSAELRKPDKIARKVLLARESPTDEQELYNSIFGLVHETKDARVTDSQIDECIRDYKLNPVLGSGLFTMGVDQGNDIHYEIDQWLPLNTNDVEINFRYRPRVVSVGVLQDFEQLDYLMNRWKIRACVIDAQPDKRSALSFANRFSGYVVLCYYGDNVKSRTLSVWPSEPVITADRTAWLDLALGRFKTNKISLPNDIGRDYKNHIKAQVRKPEKDKNGNPTARYFTAERVADHFGHARNYAEIALEFSVSGSQSRSITSPR